MCRAVITLHFTMAVKSSSNALVSRARGTAVQPSAAKAPLSYEDLPAKQQQRWDKILEAAYDLVTSQDCNIEVRDIADKSGLAMGTVYRYFQSKEVLFAELYYRWRTRFEKDLGTITVKKATSAQRILFMLTQTINLIERYPQFGDLAMAVRSSRNPIIVQRRWKMEARMNRQMKQLIKGVPSEDMDGIVWIITASFLMAVESWRAGDITIREVYEKMSETVRLLLGESEII
jgi:TetR/AcrR family transcriptional regulator, cholesterol catabolism regulator